jgi:hypothetical protein
LLLITQLTDSVTRSGEQKSWSDSNADDLQKLWEQEEQCKILLVGLWK